MLKKNSKRLLLVIGIILIILSISLLVCDYYSTRVSEITNAPLFTAKDVDNRNVSLNDSKGNVTIILIIGLENPVCIECEKQMKGQIVELNKISEEYKQNVSIITINIRKNPASEDGKKLAENWYEINITWHWIDDFNPYPVSSKYVKYWNVKGAFANPTIILIDTDLNVVGVYHVYCLGKGEIDGIQDASSLSSDISKIQRGEWEEFKGEVYSDQVTFAGMFILGIITALSPCSIALLIAMLSYVGTLGDTNNKTGSNKKANVKRSTWSGFWIGISFTIGMALMFFIFGCLISYIGFFIQISVVFYLIAGIILVILGINAIKSLKEIFANWSESIKSNKKKEEKTKSKKSFMEVGGSIFAKISGKSVYLGAFFLGILFSIGWAPCAISLVLPVLILMLTQKVTIFMGGLLLFIFGIGHGVPIIPLCTFTRGMRANLGNKYVTAGKWVEKIFGIAIIIIGIILMLRFWGINLW
ncbi:MAG: cytochrome c biogenesis protein [Thermoplasmata archaeon]|nr:cytochrome c biogenesis protein [Thermoplasmata archaeon]